MKLITQTQPFKVVQKTLDNARNKLVEKSMYRLKGLSQL